MSATINDTNQKITQRPSRRTRTVSITSGKGGVGKTTLVANTALHLGRQGRKVLVLDGDLGMANIDIMFGVRTTRSIEQVFSGEALLKDVIVEVAPNVNLIPGGSGIYGLQDITDKEKMILMSQVSELESQYDDLLVDTASGIDENVLYLNAAAHETVVVVTPDPASLADSYALIKVLNSVHRENHFSILCNQVRDEAEAKALFKRLSDVTSRFLCVSLDYNGFIPLDRDLRNATKSQQLILSSQPRSPSSFAIKQFAEKLSSSRQISGPKGGLQFFWEQLIGVA